APLIDAPASLPQQLPGRPFAAAADAALNLAAPEPPTEAPPKPITVTAPLLPVSPPPPPTGPAAAPPVAPPAFPPYLLMRELQGTYEGGVVAGARLNIYGWTEGSYTFAPHRGVWPSVQASPTDEFMMNQNWLVFERPVV